MMSFLSRRERPFFRGGALVEVVGVGAAGAGLAEVVVFFFFFPATWAQEPWEAVGTGAEVVGAWGGGGLMVGGDSGVDPEVFGGSGPVLLMGSCPFLCLLVRAGMGERRGSICWGSLLLVMVLTFQVT
jgi:hypothetical protein